jgi:hypothetical protein
MKLSIRGQMNLKASYLGQQVTRVAKEMTLRNQLTQGQAVSRITLHVALGQELRIAGNPRVKNVEV